MNAGRIRDQYPTPPSTPPPAALLAGLMAGHMDLIPHRSSMNITPHTTSKTILWAAAFMAGAQAGRFGKYRGKTIDKAEMQRMLAKCLKPYHSQLPPLPTC